MLHKTTSFQVRSCDGVCIDSAFNPVERIVMNFDDASAVTVRNDLGGPILITKIIIAMQWAILHTGQLLLKPYNEFGTEIVYGFTSIDHYEYTLDIEPDVEVFVVCIESNLPLTAALIFEILSKTELAFNAHNPFKWVSIWA